MSSYQALSISRRAAGVAQITMNRPAVFNAFDEAMIGEMDAAFAEVIADDSVRVIVLVGEGKHFSAGADLQWMQRASQATREWNVEDARRFAGMLWRIDSAPKPTIARIQGAALGGGVGLACVCDVAIAAETASFSVSEAKFGILPAVIGPYVVNAVGRRHARRLALTTARIGAAEALAMGLVDHTAPRGGALAKARQLAARTLAMPAAAVRMSKETANAVATALNHAAGHMAHDQIALAAMSDESRAAREAALKRP